MSIIIYSTPELKEDIRYLVALRSRWLEVSHSAGQENPTVCLVEYNQWKSPFPLAVIPSMCKSFFDNADFARHHFQGLEGFSCFHGPHFSMYVDTLTYHQPFENLLLNEDYGQD
jgi:hypothetical protein